MKIKKSVVAHCKGAGVYRPNQIQAYNEFSDNKIKKFDVFFFA